MIYPNSEGNWKWIEDKCGEQLWYDNTMWQCTGNKTVSYIYMEYCREPGMSCPVDCTIHTILIPLDHILQNVPFQLHIYMILLLNAINMYTGWAGNYTISYILVLKQQSDNLIIIMINMDNNVLCTDLLHISI